MKCKICGSESREVFAARILRKYDIRYYFCPGCEFLQTERPYWLAEAYDEAINRYDTGILSRNSQLSVDVAVLLYFLFQPQRRFVDYAGGYGIFTRLMRDRGFDFYWHDPFCQNMVARGFEYTPGMEGIEAVTCFEAFEHFEDPLAEIEKILSISPNIIFSTALTPDPLPAPAEWWYFGLEHGQHIAFYRPRTLRYIAERFNLDFYSNQRGLHLLVRKGLKPQQLPGDWRSLVRLSRVLLRLDAQFSSNPIRRHSTRLFHAVSRLITLRESSGRRSIPAREPDHQSISPDRSARQAASLERFIQYLAEDGVDLLRRYVTKEISSRTFADMKYLIGRGGEPANER